MTATPVTRPDDNGNHRAEAAPGDRLLEIADLNVEFHSDAGIVHAVNGVSFGVSAGETVASGRRVRFRQVGHGDGLLQLLPPTAEINGSVEFLGEELPGAATSGCGRSAAARSR